VNFPKNRWAKFQTIEYFRAFTLGRMAWSRINGLLIISGAFGMFDRQTALAAGGYDTSTVGEDLELVVRMRRYMHEVEKKKYKIAFIPDPLCWTEVPESLKILSRQRNRWTRGAIETIRKHIKMAFNPKYGRIGMISFPYWIFFEWLAPIIQFLGIGYVILLLFLDSWI
jgi:cellulose synthase/poly-beta-1,6-N-acetylglucosamine synthase-like glycosyltransferase